MKKIFILTGLLAGIAVLGFSQTAWTVNNAAGWIDAVNGIRSSGNNKEYTITVNGTVSVPSRAENTFGSVTGVTITIEGGGTLSPSRDGSLLVIGGEQTIVARDVTLRGRDANNAEVVFISDGGAFRMEGNARVTGNTSSGSSYGGGVYVNGGTFTMQNNASVTGNTGNFGGGVYVSNSGTFAMRDSASGLGNTARHSGGGVYVSYSGAFTMQNSASVSGNASPGGSGGGVYVSDSGTFTMRDSASVSGNTARYNGGGVCIDSGGAFNKTGGTIYGENAEQNLKNTVISRLGHAVYDFKNKGWRNATAGTAMNSNSNGFWLNDGNVVTFNSGLTGLWKKSNFNNNLYITENTMQSINDYYWILQLVSGNVYTLKRSDTANTMTLTINLEGNNLVISGDSGAGQDNWNGTWQKQ